MFETLQRCSVCCVDILLGANGMHACEQRKIGSRKSPRSVSCTACPRCVTYHGHLHCPRCELLYVDTPSCVCIHIRGYIRVARKCNTRHRHTHTKRAPRACTALPWQMITHHMVQLVLRYSVYQQGASGRMRQATTAATTKPSRCQRQRHQRLLLTPQPALHQARL